MINRIRTLCIISIIVLVIAAPVIIIKKADLAPKHTYKITYEVGGASRTYFVKQHTVGENGCVSFYDETGYKHTICGTYEIEPVK